MHGSLFPASLAELIRSRTLCFVLVALLVVPAAAIVGCESDSDDDDEGTVADPGDPEEEEEEEEGKKPKPDPKPKPKPNDARALASMSTQVNCDISTFFLHITDVELQQQGGGWIDLLDAPMRVDLARLDQRLKEQAIAISDVPSGEYTGARITFDLEQSLAVILDQQALINSLEPGNQEPATLVDPDGNPLVVTPAEPGENERTVSIDVIGDSLTIEEGQLGHLRLIANLAAGAVADADENELEWTPVFEAEFDPDPLQSMFAQGYLLDVSVINHQFTMGLATAFEDVGQITDVHVNESTVYQIAHGTFGVQPIAKRGVDGLKDLFDLPTGTPLLVDLRAFKNDNALLADCVNAGLGVEVTEGEDASDFAYGVVLRPTSRMHAFVAFSKEHGYRFNIQLDVDIEAGYVPFLVECDPQVRAEEWWRMRQLVVAFGHIFPKETKKKKKKVEFEKIKLSNKHCKEIEALVRVLPALHCGEHHKKDHTFDLHKETFTLEVCTIQCLPVNYIVNESSTPYSWREIHVHAPSVDLCGCCFKKEKEKKHHSHSKQKECCICFYGFRLPKEEELKLPLLGNKKVRYSNYRPSFSFFAIEVVCPEDELEVVYPRDRKCVTTSLVNDCEVWLNLLDCVRALVHSCNACEEKAEKLHKYNSHLILWAVKDGTKYFSIVDNDQVDQYLDPIDFTDAIYARVKAGDRNIYRAWASGVYDGNIQNVVFFANHIVVILQDELVEEPPTR